jgi:ubiquinone/menaquinone biosynthesis C-methylase UbiE
MWAAHFADPALMANRDAETTRRVLERLAQALPLGRTSRLLDVGPGDATLFRLVAHRVASCHGVDPSAHAVSRLRRLCADLPRVGFSVGSAEALPFADRSFDVVVVNSVLHMLPSVADAERGVAEAVRVCRAGGHVWIGELPFRSELSRGVLRHMARKLREFGPRAYARTLYHVYLRPLLRGEPLLLYPAQNLHVPQAAFEGWCERLGVRVTCRRHLECRRPSLTRNDYLLELPPG